MPYKPKKGEQTPKHIPTEATKRVVEAGAINGTSQKTLALMLDIDEDTLVKHYKDILKTGKEQFIARCTSRLRSHFIDNEEILEKAPAVALNALTFALKCKGGWKETQAIEAQVTQVQEDSELAKKIEKLDIDALIQLGKGLDKATEG